MPDTPSPADLNGSAEEPRPAASPVSTAAGDRIRQGLERLAAFDPPDVPVTDPMRMTVARVLADVHAVLADSAAHTAAHPDDIEGTLAVLTLHDLVTNAYDQPLDADPPSDAEDPSSTQRQWVLTTARRMVALHGPRALGREPSTTPARTEAWLDSQTPAIRAAAVAAAHAVARTGENA